MATTRDAGAAQLAVRLRGVSPPVMRRLRIEEQAILAQLQAAFQIAFGWSDDYLYAFPIRGCQFGGRTRTWELASDGGVDIRLAALGFEIGEPF